MEDAARRAGELALGHFQRVPAERKPDRSLVTQADRDVERFLVTWINEQLPDAGIIGEEGTRRAGRSPDLVAIDPIDGTASFVAGLPTWCICVGILHKGEAIAGVIHVPCTDDTFSAIDGVAYWNDLRLARLTSGPAPGERFILTDGNAHRRHRIAYRGKVRSLGSGAHHLALVASGAAEGALLGKAHLWDLAAPASLLAAVGGTYEYLQGGPVALAHLVDGAPARDAILAGQPDTLRALRAAIRSRT